MRKVTINRIRAIAGCAGKVKLNPSKGNPFIFLN